MSFDKFIKKPKVAPRPSDIHPDKDKPAEFGKDTTAAELYELRLARFRAKHGDLTPEEATVYFVLKWLKTVELFPFAITPWTASIWSHLAEPRTKSIMEMLEAKFPGKIRKVLFGIDQQERWDYLS